MPGRSLWTKSRYSEAFWLKRQSIQFFIHSRASLTVDWVNLMAVPLTSSTSMRTASLWSRVISCSFRRAHLNLKNRSFVSKRYSRIKSKFLFFLRSFLFRSNGHPSCASYRHRKPFADASNVGIEQEHKCWQSAKKLNFRGTYFWPGQNCDNCLNVHARRFKVIQSHFGPRAITDWPLGWSA